MWGKGEFVASLIKHSSLIFKRDEEKMVTQCQ